MHIDTHTHLLDKRFNSDRDAVLERAFSSGIESVIEISCEEPSWESAVCLSSSNEQIFCALGIHPHDSKYATDKSFSSLIMRLKENRKVVAVGETGLDFYYDNSPRNIQREVFIKHLEIAFEYKKPVIIHCRDAYDELIPVLKSFNKELPKGVVHCFSGEKEHLEKLIEMGFFIGIDGPITYPNANKLKENAILIPDNRILAETDCPYLAPQKYRGQRNEPLYIAEILLELAKLKNKTFDEISDITTTNAKKLFGI